MLLFEVVFFAQERLLVGPEVQDLAGGQLLRADRAGEAAEVVDLFPGLADVVLGQDAIPTTGAFGTETSKK